MDLRSALQDEDGGERTEAIGHAERSIPVRGLQERLSWPLDLDRETETGRDDE
jgi:hypothetical protein